MARLSVNNISKTYNSRKVVRDVSMHVESSEIVGILGPNGAGKTTTFYMVTGLIFPESGNIKLDEYEITQLPMYRRARLGIGYLPQESSIFRGLNVEENILSILEITEPDEEKRLHRLEELMADFSITHLRYTESLALSGGERRRVEIARALATNPKFLLLDEPLAGIDPIAVTEIKEIILSLKAKGIGIVITDHNVRETLSIVDRAYIFHDGAVFAHGKPAKLIKDLNVRKVYLGESFQ